MRHRALPYIVAVAICGFAATAEASSIVIDGGFEGFATGGRASGPMGAWTVGQLSSPPGVYYSGEYIGANVTEGTQAFDLGVGGYSYGNTLSQALSTVAGQQYRLTFDWGSEYDWGTNSTVTIGNLSAALVDQPGPNAAQGAQVTWLQHSASFDFVANGNDVLTFTDLSAVPLPWYTTAAGLVLDNVAVTELGPASVPDYSHTSALLAFGLLSLWTLRGRRRAA